MNRFAFAATVALTVIVTAAAQSGAFVVVSAGDQSMNPATGVVTLKKGGTVADDEHGFNVQGSYVEFRNGEYLVATNATITAKNTGTIQAGSVDYRVGPGRLVATGKPVYSSGDVKNLRAQRAVAFFKDGVVVATGGVSGDDPAITATTMVVDGDSREAFLYGPFTYVGRDGSKASGNKADSALLVDFSRGTGKARITSRVPEDKKRRYLGFIAAAR